MVGNLSNKSKSCAVPDVGCLAGSLDRFFAFASAGFGLDVTAILMDPVDALLTFTGVGAAEMAVAALSLDALDPLLTLASPGSAGVTVAAALMDVLDDLLTFTGVGAANFVATGDDLDGRRFTIFAAGVTTAATCFGSFVLQIPFFIAAACFLTSAAYSSFRWMVNFCAWLLT